MTTQPAERLPITSAADINLSDWDFWARPIEEREHAFRLLRELDKPAFFEEPETPLPVEAGPATTRSYGTRTSSRRAATRRSSARARAAR